MLLAPSVEGTAAIRAPRPAFVRAFGRRIEEGLLRGASRRRNRYVVIQAGLDSLQFRATDWATALNVGLNDVEIAASADGSASYRIQYMRWAAYALALSGALGLLLVAFFLFFDLRGYIERHYGPAYLGLSVDQNIVIAWAMALFWGFVWPWILIALHKRPLRRLMEQLIAEVDTAARAETPAGGSHA